MVGSPIISQSCEINRCIKCRHSVYVVVSVILGTYFEGDIKLDRNTKVLKQGRVSVISRWYTWSNAIVPYDFDSSLG